MKKVYYAAICLAMSLFMALSSVATAAPSHRSHPAPMEMAISAPAAVQTGEKFTVKITRKIDQSPIEGTQVYLVPRYEPFYLGSGINYKPQSAVPKSLGATGAEGELKVTIAFPGDFFLTAEKAGFTQSFLAITAGGIANEASFTASKQVFSQGEPVAFTLTNGLASTITLSCGAPWDITGPKGAMVFTPFSTMTIVDVRPGETKTWTWNQTNQEGMQVEPGMYVVTLRTSAGHMSARFCITGLKSEKGRQNPNPEMPEVSPFEDVSGEHLWGNPHVLSLYANNIVKGKSADSFDPEGSLTRAEFLAMLLRACKAEPWPEAVEGALLGVDVSHWAYRHVRTAMEIGIIKPEEYPEDFGPDIPITRIEICVMSARALGLENEAGENAGAMLDFDDSEDISLTYRGYVISAVDWGILKGYPDHTFRPGKNATRREAAVIIYRLIQVD